MDLRPSQHLPLAAGIDTAIVVAFVAIGRRNHDEGTAITGVAGTAAPFIVGLLVGWLAMRAWRHPIGWRTGVGVWLITVAVGMLTRRFVFDDGTATSFVIVATTFLGLLVGWRVVVGLLARRPLAA